MGMWFKHPSGGAIAMLSTLVMGGIGLAYLPTQISETPGLQNAWQVRWGPTISTLGLIIAGTAIIVFVVTHVCWPHWITDIGRLRVRFYKTPYWPDILLLSAQSNLAGSLKVTKKTVELHPHGWDNRDPFIRITYHVFNGSLFPVSFTEPRGDLYVNNSKLHDQPTLSSGEGWWPSLQTAQLRIDQRLRLEFWNELAQYEQPGSVIEPLIGYFTVSLTAKCPEMKTVGISLSSDTPFLTERRD